MSTSKVSHGRSIDVDALRGLAILLVVVGHAIQYQNQESFKDNLLFRAIYSFHMPLFFFISGQVAGRYTTVFSVELLVKRSRSLLIPWGIWTFIFSLAYFFTHKNQASLSEVTQFYWFLPVLFACYFTIFGFFIIRNWLGNSYLPLILSLFAWLFTFRLDGFWASSIRYHLIYFTIGYGIGKNQITLEQLRYFKPICILFYSLAFLYFTAYIPLFSASNLKNQYLNFLLKISIALVLTLSVWRTTMLLNKGIKKALAFLGAYSIQIYLLHLIAIQYIKIESTLISKIETVICLIVFSILLAKIIERFNVNKYIFGK